MYIQAPRRGEQRRDHQVLVTAMMIMIIIMIMIIVNTKHMLVIIKCMSKK